MTMERDDDRPWSRTAPAQRWDYIVIGSGMGGMTTAALLAKQEAYNDKDYHQPSDEYDPSWDFTGAANDARLLTALVWQVVAAPAMPTYNEGDQFAQVRRK